MKLGPYQAWLLDCDGVILDSNAIKTEAFYELARPYGEDVAQAFVDHHRRHGGVSRFVKVKYLHEELLGDADEERIREGVEAYGRIVRERLATCREAPGLRDFLGNIPAGTYRAVISGGLQDEVRSVLQTRGLASYFDDVFGSPRKKAAIFESLADAGRLAQRAVYLGDSRYDFEVARDFGVDFVFVYGMTEFEDWREFFAHAPVPTVEYLAMIQPE